MSASHQPQPTTWRAAIAFAITFAAMVAACYALAANGAGVR